MSVTQSGTTNRTDYLLDGQNVVQEFHEVEGEGGTELQLLATYCLGGRGIEYRTDSSGVRSWYLYDGLGSVLAEIGDLDSSYNVTLTATPKTDVYGNPVTTETGSNHRFCGGLGHKTDSDTGLVYMRARYYDPAIGRFASEDPARHGVVWFVYCNNNPANGLDPSGMVSLGLVDNGTAVAEGVGLDASMGQAVSAFGRYLVNKLAQACARQSIKITVEFVENGIIPKGMGDGAFRATMSQLTVYLGPGGRNVPTLMHELGEAYMWYLGKGGVVSDYADAMMRRFMTFL